MVFDRGLTECLLYLQIGHSTSLQEFGDASDFVSEVYYCELKTDKGFAQMRKLLLIT